MRLITANNKYIKSLSFTNCYSITNNGFKYISENLCHLKNFLLLKNNTDEEHIKSIAMNNKNLQKLPLYGCRNISEECVVYLKDLLPHCNIDYNDGETTLTF